MAVLTVQTSSRAGFSLVTADVAADVAGDSWANGGGEVLFVRNGGGAPITVTLVYQATTDGQAVTNKTVSVTNAHEFIIGPFPTTLYNDSNGRCNVTYSAVTSVTVAVFKLGA